MATFLATGSRWLLEGLEEEVRALGFESVRRVPGGVEFESNWEGCYRANLWLRTASRVVLPILDFPTYDADDLYHNIRKHDFTKYIEARQTLAVDATSRESAHRDGRFVAMRVKDAIVDQFREKFEIRPDVDSKDPDLRVIVSVYKNQAAVSIDTSGDPLFKRGYREVSVEAPLKETLAASLIKLSGWTPDQVLMDPMCGSGTIGIEAALIAHNIAPGTLRKRFGFQRLKGFQKDAWEKVVEQALDGELTDVKPKIFISDREREAVQAARKNALRAGVLDSLMLRRMSVDLISPPTLEELGGEPAKTGIVLTNPPYGERLEHEFEDSIKDLGFALKNRFAGWKAYVLSGYAESGNIMGLKASRKWPVMNGRIECRLLQYHIRALPQRPEK